MQVIFSPGELLSMVGAATTRGTTSRNITGIGSLDTAEVGELSFLGNPKYRSSVASSKASVLLLPHDYEGEPAIDQLFILLENPSVALARICARIEQQMWPRPAAGVHPSAVVSAEAKIAATATIGPLCVIESGAVVGERAHLQAQIFIGRNAVVGDDCWLKPGVILGTECVLKDRVRLHAGVVVGSDGFGYEFVAGRHEKVPQVGHVIIEDDVEIGANCTLDRARFSRTVIGEGTKIDNLVQIAHNVTIGKHCILCAQVGIAGSVVIDDYVVLGGQVGVAGHLKVGRGVKAGGQAGITAAIEPGQFVNGNPAMPYMLERRLHILHRRLPELFKRVDALEGKL
jgi:UDP-3-O-[3-hydroxymyristoyl] glucosamine N-acyltransferase